VAIVLPIHLFEACVADVLFPGCTISKTRITGAKYRPEYTIAGCLFTFSALSTQSAARLAPDLVLPRLLAANDMALLDQNPAIRRQPSENQYWVVADGSGLRIRYVRLGGAKVYLANEATVDDPRSWQSVSLAERDILDIVRARIVWIGREMEMEPSGPAQPPGEIY